MISRFPPSRGHFALFLLTALIVFAVASCSAGPASQPATTAPTAPGNGGVSVQDQLAQLAAGAAQTPSQTPSGAAPSATTQPTVRASATPGATQSTAAVQPKPARTKRPPATRTVGATRTVRATRTPAARTPAARTPTPSDNLPTITQAKLPREARTTIRLIEQGGPFPYDRDGVTFGNREGLLPKRPNGYYKEYTVVTPGSADRGARRIIAGRGGELYYTDDHYDSFKRVVP